MLQILQNGFLGKCVNICSGVSASFLRASAFRGSPSASSGVSASFLRASAFRGSPSARSARGTSSRGCEPFSGALEAAPPCSDSTGFSSTPSSATSARFGPSASATDGAASSSRIEPDGYAARASSSESGGPSGGPDGYAGIAVGVGVNLVPWENSIGLISSSYCGTYSTTLEAQIRAFLGILSLHRLISWGATR